MPPVTGVPLAAVAELVPATDSSAAVSATAEPAAIALRIEIFILIFLPSKLMEGQVNEGNLTSTLVRLVNNAAGL
ncbi:unannotated protein [freshwater metagenome]|uniref:Unannotated protein n=1 Tax=freshwater metagenome TaxID=449393 RepID=A0A6J7JZG3_9ZZZZ